MKQENDKTSKTPNWYFEFQAVIGMTKHMGGFKATQQLAESCHIDRDKYVLEIGCGLGRSACYLAKKFGCRVLGIDISEKMVEQAAIRAQREGLEELVEFRVQDAQNLTFEDSSFDAVIGESVMAFIPDKPLALREFMRVTKSGGYVGFNECTWNKKPPAELVKYVGAVMGADFHTADEWQGIWTNVFLQKVSVETYQVRILEQWRNEIREMEFQEYFGAWRRFLSLLFTSPESRTWVRKTLSLPRNIFSLFKYLGYGIYIGRK
ncbi:MAG: methyltransferase domain-containing protein [Syntrophomonadaceae bacterium]